MQNLGETKRFVSVKVRATMVACARYKFIPFLIVFAAVVMGGMVIQNHQRSVSSLKERILEESQLRMQASAKQELSDFEAVHSTIFFISKNASIRAMVTNKQEQLFIQQLYDYQQSHNHLEEVYVVERDFTGKEMPFLKFEPSSDRPRYDEIHTVDREQDEYKAQIEQIRLFQAKPTLDGAISPELNLCVNDDDGNRRRGFVYSVPIWVANKLVGIVAGMVPTETICDTLEKGQYRQVALLMNERGEVFGGKSGHENLRAWFKEKIKEQGAAKFFAKAPTKFPVEGWDALWTKMKMEVDQRWWLVYLYDQKEYLQRASFAGTLGSTSLAGMLVLAGLALAMLLQTMRRRLEEESRHLVERKQLERQVQEVSEREQRRIGEGLNEDLCQRLSGIVTVSKVLSKKLSAKQIPESVLADEISVGIIDSLQHARQLADELEPISLLADGLLAALIELAAHTSERGGIRCWVNEQDFPEIHDRLAASQFYRITQEALNNVVKHAQAKEAFINVCKTRIGLTLTVSDDGIGIPADFAQGHGLGLRIMRYRSDLIGAEFDVQPAKPRGTIVTCSCPLTNGTDYASLAGSKGELNADDAGN